MKQNGHKNKKLLMKKYYLILLLTFLQITKSFTQTDLLDVNTCIFEYGEANFTSPTSIGFTKKGSGMLSTHFVLVNDYAKKQDNTGLPEIPFPGVNALKINSLANNKAAKVRIPLDLNSADIVIIHWSGWLQAPGHSPAPYADGGLAISLYDNDNNFLCSGFYFANGYMEDKDVWKTTPGFIYTDKWQQLFIDTKSLKNTGITNVFIDFTVYGCNAGGHESCIWIAMTSDKSNQVKKIFCKDELILTAVDAAEYKWYLDTTLIANTQTIKVKTPGNYKVIIKPQLGCDTEYNISITDSIKNNKPIAIPRQNKAMCGDSIAVDIYQIIGTDSTLLETKYIHYDGEIIYFKSDEYCDEYCDEYTFVINAEFSCPECPEPPPCPWEWWFWLIAFILGLLLGWLLSKLFKSKYKILVINKDKEVTRVLKNNQKFITEDKDYS